MICISQVYFLVCFCNKTRKQMDHRKPHFDYHNWDSVWFCFQSGDGNVMFGGRQESVWLFGWPRANRQPGDGVFQWADCFLSHSFHIKLNNWIFKFVRFLLTCAAGGQQAGRIKRGSIHLKGLVTFFSYTSVHLKKKKVWSSVSSVLPVVRCLQREQTPVVYLCDAVPRSHLGRA